MVERPVLPLRGWQGEGPLVSPPKYVMSTLSRLFRYIETWVDLPGDWSEEHVIAVSDPMLARDACLGCGLVEHKDYMLNKSGLIAFATDTAFDMAVQRLEGKKVEVPAFRFVLRGTF